MRTSNKINILINHGFKPSMLLKLNEGQIDMMYTRLKEAITTQNLPPMKVTKITPDSAKSTGANVGPVDITMDASGNIIAKGPVNAGKSETKNKDSVLSDAEMKEEMDFLKGKKKKEVKEKSLSKQQQKFFGAVRSMQKGNTPKKGEAGKVAEKMSKKDVKDFASTKHKGLPQKKETKENYMDMIGKSMNRNISVNVLDRVRPVVDYSAALEENIKNMIDKHITPKITKRDFLKFIMEDSDTKEAPTKPKTKPGTKEKERTKPDTPYRPKPGPEKAPKAKKRETKEATETAPVKPKPGTKPFTKPGTKPSPRPDTPYRPKPGPEKAPKAGRRDLPDWLSFDSIGLNF